MVKFSTTFFKTIKLTNTGNKTLNFAITMEKDEFSHAMFKNNVQTKLKM
jgi:hypothetical protein